VRTLDARKDEAIARTFKGVAGHFKQARGAAGGLAGWRVVTAAPEFAPVVRVRRLSQSATT
jgi:hypothetical protein